MCSGLLITLESPEGGGKTLLAKGLKDYYEFMGQSVLVSREPGGVEVSEKIRNIVVNDKMHPITEAYLYLAARAEHVQKVIKPALKAGKIVILDRFLYSTLAIQGGGRGLPIQELRRLHDLALDGIYPDINLFLDVPPEVGLARKRNQNEINKFELEDLEFHNKVYETYNRLVNNKELIRIDGTQEPYKVLQDAIKVLIK